MRLKTTLLWLVCLWVGLSANLADAQPDTVMTQLSSLSANCNQPPIIICPSDFESCPGTSTDPANTGYASGLAASPICSPPIINYSDSLVSNGGCPGSTHIIRTWIATDPQIPGLTSTCTQQIILSDTTPPLILDCPRDTTVAPNGKCFANVFWSQPLVLDDCGRLDLDVTHISGDRYPLGETEVIYTATDACGNVSTCTFTITVEGECCDLPPIITCPGDYLGCPGDTILPKKIGRARAIGGRPNCDPPAVFYRDDTVSTGPCVGGVVINRVWTAVDPHDPSLTATCTQSVILKDEIQPFIFGCPGDISVDSDDNCKAIVNWVPPTARDNCNGVKLESNFAPGDTFMLGITTVLYVATDSCGNRRTCSFDVEVKKACCDEEPIIFCPDDYFGCPGTSTDTSITGTATAEPGGPFCDPPIIRFEESIVSEGPCPDALKIKRLWIAQDPDNPMLRSTCTQFITLQDTTSPSLDFSPGDTIVMPDYNCEAVIFWSEPIFSDSCGSLTIEASHQPGDTFNVGTTVVSYKATDLCGNLTFCTFKITVTDDCCQKPPLIACPPDFYGCPGIEPIPDNTGQPDVMKGSPLCKDPIVTYSDDTSSVGPCAGALMIQRTWTVMDPDIPGFMKSCTQSITLEDTIPPVLSNCPRDTTVSPNQDCEAVVFWTRPDMSDNCGVQMLSSTHQPGDTFDIGVTTVEYTLTDICGNITTCSFDITVTDSCCNKPPVITCPTDYFGCPRTPLDPATTGMATAVKGHPDCADPVISSKDQIVSTGPCPGALVIQRSWVATDPNTGLADTCMQIITLNDTIPPVISSCPGDTTLSPNIDCEAQVFWNDPTASDNCGAVSFSSSHQSGDTFPIGQTTVTIIATDGCGLTDTCSFVITVLDDCCNKPPAITCPTDYFGCPRTPLDPATTGMATAVKGHPDCADPVISSKDQIVSTGPCPGALVVQRSWFATDPNTGLADTCMQIITLNDTIPPVITSCPGDTTLSPNIDCEAQVFWSDPVGSDNCGAISFSSTHQSGDTFPIGQTTVTIIATDGCGLTDACSFLITVLDDCCNKPPVITCPTDYFGCPRTPLDPATTGMATAVKGHPDCADPVISSKDQIVSTGPCPGALVVQRSWFATDPNTGLADTCMQIITLNDTMPPVITSCPGDTTLSPNIDCEAQVFWNDPVGSDNCGAISFSSSHQSGDTFPIGQTTVTIIATDGCGLTDTCSFVITVLDDCCNKPPVITCPADYFGCPGVRIDPALTGMATAAKGHPTCDDPVILFADEELSSGPCMGARVVRRTWTATDPNTSLADTCIQMITLEDTIPPTLSSCPRDTTLSPNVDCEARVMWSRPVYDDNCGMPMLTSSHQSGDLFPIGQTTVTITITDGCGNKTSCSFVITVLDDCCNKPPVITCPADYENCPGSSIDTAQTGSATATKGHPKCDDPVITFSDEVLSTGPCAGATEILRTWIATDPNDTTLADTCTQTITLIDNEDPVLVNCPRDTQVMADETCEAILSWTPPTMMDNCGGGGITSTHEPGDTFGVGITTVTYTATDGCGNMSTCSFDVEVTAQNLHIMCPNDTVITKPTFSFGEYVYLNPPQVVECDPTCPDSLPGFMYMGERNGHRYFCSNFRASWTDAQRICDSLGGHLAVVNDEAENDYLAGLLMGQPAYIGLNDFATEGEFEWVNGDPLTFTSWRSGQPDNKNNYQDAVELYPDGQWEDQFYYVNNEFICEVPCYTVEQVSGPKSGEFFTCGDHEITYVATDNLGQSDTCSYIVTVDCNSFDPYCDARGLSTANYWLNSVKVEDFFKYTGNDYGYGDYTASCIDLSSGQTEQICLGLGYSGAARNLYWRVWIDYNGDRDFDDRGEKVAEGFGSWAVCGDIHVPAQTNIRTIMRVGVAYGRWPQTCGTVDEGEYEDYCVVIEDGTALNVLPGQEPTVDQKVMDAKREMSLFPNPTHDALQVEWEGEKPSRADILDMMGRPIWQRTHMETLSMGIDVHNWSPGRYLLRAHYQDGSVVTKSFMVVK